MVGLERFKAAQSRRWSGFDAALQEIREGGKRSHWIWYVFPQIDGLGRSGAATEFAIRDADEAQQYLEDSELYSHLLTISEAVAEQLEASSDLTVRELMGSDIDALKLVSSLTLFTTVARAAVAANNPYAKFLAAADFVLSRAESQGYPRCSFTLGRLNVRQ
jgi:uncharacterized protein (DUF1810 family)